MKGLTILRFHDGEWDIMRVDVTTGNHAAKPELRLQSLVTERWEYNVKGIITKENHSRHKRIFVCLKAADGAALKYQTMLLEVKHHTKLQAPPKEAAQRLEVTLLRLYLKPNTSLQDFSLWLAVGPPHV